jgi:alginate O-acetyltransferase complex protein AlgI
MTFTTLTFLLFLAVLLPAYWALKTRQSQNYLLLLCSYFFYGWWDWRFCLLMFLTSLQDWAIAWAIHSTDRPRLRRGLLAANIAVNLGVLGYFKYSGFFVSSVKMTMERMGIDASFTTLEILLPAGISFYTFQALSYTVDVYRRRLEPTRHLAEYLAFISFFPHLVAGPIMRAALLLPQFLKERTFSPADAADGVRQMLWGFAKKMVVADNLGPVVDAVYSAPMARPGPQLLGATLLFAFQIYCDFSAYSDIAVGTAKLFGFRLMRNFAFPYFSQSPTEFWRRWHISLSTWFRDYLYVPLGGNRHGEARRRLNVFLTFLLSGLWHGGAWHFVVWGALHGLYVLLEPARLRAAAPQGDETPGGTRPLPSPAVLARILATFALTLVTWVFFRAANNRDALFILRRIAGDLVRPAEWASLPPLLVSSALGALLPAILVLLVLVEWVTRSHPHPFRALEGRARLLRWGTYATTVLAILWFGTHKSVPFIYFQF